MYAHVFWRTYCPEEHRRQVLNAASDTLDQRGEELLLGWVNGLGSLHKAYVSMQPGSSCKH